MDKSIIKENIASVLFVMITLSAGFIYLITEYKALESKKSILSQKLNDEKIELNEQKNEIKLMQKDLENQILQAKLKHKDDLVEIKNIKSKSSLIESKEYQQYQIKMNTLVSKQGIEIENLTTKINIRNNEIIILNKTLEKLKKENKELSTFINNMHNAEKISNLISKHLSKYLNISKNKYDKYEHYLQAIDEYESIHSLIKTYKLTDEFSPFIRNMRKKYYLN
ncbi:hypothetical protein ACMC56_06740 [Campylobacterota bacterium DY0563]